MEGAGTAVCLVMKAVLLSGRWAGRTRRLGLEQAAKASGDGAGVLAGIIEQPAYGIYHAVNSGSCT